MGAGRKKRRTHVKPEANPNAAKTPKSFVIRSGNVSRLASQLVSDMRKVMEPNTATKLKERKKNKLKDYVTVAGPMGVSHLLLFSQTETTTNLRIGKFPQGPTCFFRILEFSLMKDVTALQKKPKAASNEYLCAPLLVLNNLPVETSHGKLLCSMLQNMYPSINTSQVKLGEIRRVVLFHYNKEEDTLEFRHFIIHVKMVGVSKSLKRIIRSEIPDMSNFADAAEYILKAEANMSDSEMEADSVVTVSQADTTSTDGGSKSHQKSINLVECGPRMTLRLMKVSDGFNGGKVLYHVPLETKADASNENDDDENDDDLTEGEE